MVTYKISFTNCQPIRVSTLQGEVEAIRTAIKQSVAHLKVYHKIDTTFNQQRKNIISSVLI